MTTANTTSGRADVAAPRAATGNSAPSFDSILVDLTEMPLDSLRLDGCDPVLSQSLRRLLDEADASDGGIARFDSSI